MYEIINPLDFTENPFKLIGNDWMLISADDGKTKNAMTASWGGVGILFNKPVCFCFIRPQRYTYKIAENTDKITLSFFSDKYKKQLSYFGSVSGYNENKILKSNFSVIEKNGYIWYNEARLVIKANKLYADFLKESCFFDKSVLDNYKKKDYHKFYIFEIAEILKLKE